MVLCGLRRPYPGAIAARAPWRGPVRGVPRSQASKPKSTGDAVLKGSKYPKGPCRYMVYGI